MVRTGTHDLDVFYLIGFQPKLYLRSTRRTLKNTWVQVTPQTDEINVFRTGMWVSASLGLPL